MIKREIEEHPTEQRLCGAKILCVDDDPVAAELVRIILVGEGAEVMVLASAEAAILLLKSERFDLLLSDLSMPPGLDGYDLMHALRRMEELDPSRQDMLSVAVSGDAVRPSKKRRFGDFQVYLSKPFKAKRLLDVVERLLEAQGEVVKNGSLNLWEAKIATEAAEDATEAANDATEAAAMATEAAHQAMRTAQSGTAAAVKAEEASALASSKAPRW
ncbi:MAG: response regulator [Pseudobdellovibrionaceae bacterium]|nr:response regulator [Pseudobdellovibrionaceae bacterium]